MNRKMLAESLVGISEGLGAAESATASEMSEGRRAAAGRMLLLAKQLAGFDVTKEFEATVKTTEDLARQFKDAHADLISEINEAEKALKDKQDVLKAYYKDWATQSGYKPLKAALLQQAQQCMGIGDTLDGLAGELKVARRESEQESYKEKYNILVSMLNEAELKKYARLLGLFFAKQITELKTGLKLLDDDLKAWHAEAQAIAEERNVKLPKASVRRAGLVEDAADAVRSLVPKLVETVRGFFSGLMDRVLRNGKTLDQMDRDLGSMVARARAVL